MAVKKKITGTGEDGVRQIGAEKHPGEGEAADLFEMKPKGFIAVLLRTAHVTMIKATEYRHCNPDIPEATLRNELSILN